MIYSIDINKNSYEKLFLIILSAIGCCIWILSIPENVRITGLVVFILVIFGLSLSVVNTKIFIPTVLIYFHLLPIISTSSYTIKLGSISGNILGIVNLLLFSIGVFLLFINKKCITWSTLNKLSLALIVFAFLNGFRCPDLAQFIKSFTRLSIPIIVYLIYQIYNTAERKKIFKFIFALSLIYIIESYIYLIFDINIYSYRSYYIRLYTFFGGHPAGVTYYLALLSIISIGLYIIRNEKFYLFYGLLTFPIILFGQTRIVWIGLVLSLIYLFYSLKKFRTLLIFMFSSLVIFWFSESVQYRFGLSANSNIQKKEYGSIDGRFYLWKNAINHLNYSDLIFGKGTGFTDTIFGFSSDDNADKNIASTNVKTPHNEYLRFVLDMGFVGLILFCCYIFKLNRLVANSTDYKYIVHSVFICFSLHAITDNPIGYNRFTYIIYLLPVYFSSYTIIKK